MGPLVPGLGSLARPLNSASPLTKAVRKPAVGLVAHDRCRGGVAEGARPEGSELLTWRPHALKDWRGDQD